MKKRLCSSFAVLFLLLTCSLLLAAGCTGKSEGAGEKGDKKDRKAGETTAAAKKTKTYLAAMKKGYAWLAAKQNENGSFGQIPGAKEPGEVGYTGLILKAYAEAPEEIRSRYGTLMEKAAEQLVAIQQGNGSIGPKGGGLTTYRTSIAIMALSAYDRKKYAKVIEKGRDFVAGSQFSEARGVKSTNPHYGGFGYDRSGTKPDADMSNMQFALQALKEAGLDEKSPVWKRAVLFLQRCQNRTESNDLLKIGVDVQVSDDGGFMYDPGLSENKSEIKVLPNGKRQLASYASMTYAGLMSLIHARIARDDPRVQAACKWIRTHYTLDENYGLGTRKNPKKAQQGLFYYYHVFAKAMEAYGEPVIVTEKGMRRVWARDLLERLVTLQKPEGFWVNEEARWYESDALLVTAYSLLAMNTALRNLKGE
jgi:squalene-hopene/tetraprenyl-beta-curcumene cyclase